eukprot:TRINITY_DN167_c3_g1_i1.p1 TRINITY_DN167_c3_g1~~TRINITY_DN167_c3_g1_i1.p1  ORF type:complete len:429 (-),score=162.58 TRINITY_DN167_c3_g1_i1:15-1301(-)
MKLFSCNLMIYLIICISIVYTTIDIKGVSPENLDIYLKDEFICDDVKIPKSSINDNYCDCENGKDEPGTNACENGRFWCENKGYESLVIPSSFVNDGICDCCDGSDEYNDLVRCENICLEVGKERRKELKMELKLQREGLKIKNEWIKYADEHFNDLVTKIENKKEECNDLNDLLEEALEQKENAEEYQNVAKELIDDGKREDETWIREDESIDQVDDEDTIEYLKRVEEFGYYKERAEQFEKTHGYTPHEFIESVKEAQNNYREISSQVSDCNNELEKLEKHLHTDFGPQKEFFKLLDESFEYNTDQYRYTVELFNQVRQGGTNMGTFDEWLNSDYTMIHYSNGQRCWGAGNRETTIHLRCATENSISDVTEPNKCVYELIFHTPAACTSDRVSDLVKILDLQDKNDKDIDEMLKALDKTSSTFSWW